MMKAIASPSSVVCTVSPFEHAPAHLPARRGHHRFGLAPMR
jgi:hypothetical protein